MFWSKPKCPIDTENKAWTERRMAWLADRLGLERMRAATVILPTDEFFPSLTVDSPNIDVLGAQVADYMSVSVQDVKFVVTPDLSMPGAAGLYERGARKVIHVAESNMTDPTRLIGTLAHEISHEMLLGQGLLTGDEHDHEWVTDLLPTFLGMGIFLANGTVESRAWTDGQMSSWSISRQGYLPSHVLGYSLALFAFMRGEETPEWATYLRRDAQVPFKNGLAYLRKCNDTDSLFHPNSYPPSCWNWTASQLRDALHSKSPTERLASLWGIGERQLENPELVPDLTALLSDADPSITVEAARLLGRIALQAQDSVSALLQALDARDPRIRAAAAEALGHVANQNDSVLPRLAYAVHDNDVGVVRAAAQALGFFGLRAQPHARNLKDPLIRAILEWEVDDCGIYLTTLQKITGDFDAFLQEHLRIGNDFGLYRQAVEALRLTKSEKSLAVAKMATDAST